MKENRNTTENKVYLVPLTDGTWKTRITDIPPTSDAAVISPEGTYPVDVYYHRIDLNGSCTIEKECCQARDELISALDWLSQCGAPLLTFWAFDHKKPMETALIDILNNSYDRAYQLRQQALREIELEMEQKLHGSLAPSPESIPTGSYCVIVTKAELDNLIQALNVMGDRMADREGYSAGEDYWDLKEKLEQLEPAGPNQKSFGQIISDAQVRSSAEKPAPHAISKDDDLEI